MRWASCDPVGLVDRAANLYSYSVNNPIRNVDPGGTQDYAAEEPNAKPVNNPNAASPSAPAGTNAPPDSTSCTGKAPICGGWEPAENPAATPTAKSPPSSLAPGDETVPIKPQRIPSNGELRGNNNRALGEGHFGELATIGPTPPKEVEREPEIRQQMREEESRILHPTASDYVATENGRLMRPNMPVLRPRIESRFDVTGGFAFAGKEIEYNFFRGGFFFVGGYAPHEGLSLSALIEYGIGTKFANTSWGIEVGLKHPEKLGRNYNWRQNLFADRLDLYELGFGKVGSLGTIRRVNEEEDEEEGEFGVYYSPPTVGLDWGLGLDFEKQH
jgi:hypothetical protein